MLGFDFVSHESFPEDEYTKEAVVLCIDKKHRVTYVRKRMSSGAMFWDVIACSVKVNGEKKYLKAFSQDSNFLQEDIKTFLENRSWEKNAMLGGKLFASSKKNEDDEKIQELQECDFPF